MWRHGDVVTWRRGDMETWGFGDVGTWRRGDAFDRVRESPSFLGGQNARRFYYGYLISVFEPLWLVLTVDVHPLHHYSSTEALG